MYVIGSAGAATVVFLLVLLCLIFLKLYRGIDD